MSDQEINISTKKNEECSIKTPRKRVPGIDEGHFIVPHLMTLYHQKYLKPKKRRLIIAMEALLFDKFLLLIHHKVNK